MGISFNVVDIKAKLCSRLVWQQSEIRRSVWAKETPVNLICRLLHSGYSTIWSGQMTRNIFLFCWSPILSLSVSNQTSHSHTKVKINTVMVFVFCELIRCGGNLLELLSQFVGWNESRCKCPLMSSFFPFILQSSPLCVAAIHAGVVSNVMGGRISVVSSKGIPHYEATLANNVTSTG